MICTVVVLIFLCYGTEAKTDEAFKDLVIRMHNNYRKQQHASNMDALVWNDTLAQIADRWLANCNFEHEKKGWGENLFYDTNEDKSSEVLIEDAMKVWYDEINLYTYSSGACGMACHYTQVVWHNTKQVGCAEIRCPSLNNGGSRIENAWMFGCWYSPKGNWVGEYAFEKGDPCKKCLDDQGCEDGLCTGEGVEVCEDKNTNCPSWAASGSCESNAEYMDRECRLSCKKCKGKPGQKAECKDIESAANCESWKYSCKTNPAFMKLNCAKTCGCEGL